MSNPMCHAGRMKVKNCYQIPLVALMFQTATIARFGPARLVRKPDGRHECIGGTADLNVTSMFFLRAVLVGF